MLEKIRAAMDKYLSTLAALLFLIAVLASVVGVLDRTFSLNLKTVWAEEVTRYLMIWASLLLIGVGLRKGTQTRLTLLSEHLPEKGGKLLNIFAMLLVVLLFGILFVYGLRSAVNNAGQMSAVMQISMFWPYLAIPVSSFFVLFEAVTEIFETVVSLGAEK